MSRGQFAAVSALACVCLLGATAYAAPTKTKAKVVEVRDGRVYLELSGGKPLEPGRRVVIQRGAKKTPGKLLSASSKYALVAVGKKTRFRRGQAVVLVADGAVGAAPQAKPGASKRVGGKGMTIGRSIPTLQEFLRVPLPEKELVGYRGVAEAEEDALEVKEGEEPDFDYQRLVDNEIRGEFELGIDGAYKDVPRVARVAVKRGKVSRNTPFAKLRLEIDRVGGSDRARILFYGSARHPNGGKSDWTQQNKEQLRVRLSAAVFRIDSKRGEADGFTDRIEFAIGRDTVPSVVQAGLVDGMQFGLRFGPATFFAFGGAAAALNPRRADYDSLIWGGGVRFAHAFEHDGAIRFSLAGAIERFRSENERGFLESRADIRYGAFGLRGAAVYDIFSSVENDRDQRLTTGELIAFVQFTPDVRFEAGYRERRAVYTGELVKIDLEDPNPTLPQIDPDRPTIDPILYNPLAVNPRIDRIERAARRNIWTQLELRFSEHIDLTLRGEFLQSRESRNMRGGEIGLGINDLIADNDRIGIVVAMRHRLKGNTYVRHVSEPYTNISYSYFGEKLQWGVVFVFRITKPKRIGESRYAGRVWFDGDIAGGFGVRGYVQGDMVRGGQEDDEPLYLAGLAARLRF